MMKANSVLVLGALLFLSTTGLAQTIQPTFVKKDSWVTYRISHPLHEVEATSKDMVYQIVMDPASRQIKSVSGQVDVTTFDSGNSNRDSHAMEVIDALTYPQVTFSSTSIEAAGDSLRVSGTLTFHGVSKPIVVAAATRWEQNRLEVEGAFTLSLTEFKIERPSLLMIPVDDTLKFSLKALFAWGEVHG